MDLAYVVVSVHTVHVVFSVHADGTFSFFAIADEINFSLPSEST